MADHKEYGVWARRLFLILALATQAAGGQEVGVAARVGGAEITLFRLERHFEDFLRERGRNLATIRNPTAYKRLKREALEQLIDRELLAQEAERRGIAIPAAEVDAARDRIAAVYRTPEAFRRRLDEAGFSESGFADYLRRDLMAGRALAAMAQAAEPDDETAGDHVPQAEVRRRVLQDLRQGGRVEVLLSL